MIAGLSSRESAEWLERAEQIPGLDVRVGIANCGSEDEYMSAVKIFYDTIAGKAEEIEDHYDSGNLEYFTIKVHALKSAARLIGAVVISDIARNLEEAGKSGDLEFIKTETPHLLSLFRELKDDLDKLYHDTENVTETGRAIGDDLISKAYEELLGYTERMDYDGMENIMDNLEKFDLPAKERERYEALKVAWLEMDYPQMISLLRGE